MTRSRLGLIPLALLAACVAPREVPPPHPRPAAPKPVVPPKEAPLVQAGEDWRDLPLTAGDWHYDAARTASRFGPAGAALFTARCDRGRRLVTLVRSGRSAGPMIIQTSSGPRSLPVTASAEGPAATLGASDPLLDAIAFSRGRFVVTSPPDARLVIPAWPAFARVVEDCRS